MSEKRMRFVVIFESEPLTQRCFGIFRSFKAAENAAKAIDHLGKAYVLPIEREEDMP